MGRRVEHEGDISVTAGRVALTKSTRITGSMKIQGDVRIAGERTVNGPQLVISGKVTMAPGSQVTLDGSIIHNGEVEEK